MTRRERSSPQKTMTFRIIFSIFLLLHHQAAAEFGDTVGSLDQCPAFTTCPVVCVESLQDCPTQCPQGLFTCLDGTCRADCTDSRADPCPYSCAPYACPKVDDTYDSCQTRFGNLYQQATQCAEQEQAKAQQSVTFREAPFVLMALWICVVTAAILLYCAYNQKFRREEISLQPLGESSYIAGFQTDLLGTVIYYATVVTIWGFQIVFFVLVILYYLNQGAITAVEAIWRDERQILGTFEVVWMVGFVWNLTLKWPNNLRSLFWKRCAVDNATYVAVWTQHDFSHGIVASNRYVTALRRLLSILRRGLYQFMARVFSEDTTLADGQWTFCPVVVDIDGTAHFVHNFRRYNLQNNLFVPAEWQTNPTVGELLEGRNGLSSEQVQTRRAVVGTNTIQMTRPSFARVVRQEFTQPYYTYQNFIMWSWMPLYYYYMAIVQTIVIMVGGITVCIFRHRNEQSLYQLTHMDGDVNVLRDGNFAIVSQGDLVPGDIVMVEPGRTYCDMVLVKSAGVLVDESALTGESTPVAKTAIDPSEASLAYGSKPGHKRHTIQAGTTVLESETGHNLAIVTKTGSYTTKGELLRDIFSYQRHQFKFDVEVGVVVMILFFYAIVAFSIVFHLLNYTAVYGWFYGMYAVASVLPPLLPTVFTVSVGVSDNRLAKQNIACTNSEEILVAGKVKRAFFDKTGTLTKQGLEFISARNSSSWANVEDTDQFSNEMAMAMATCHSLTRSIGGDLIGNPVDRTMFAAGGATFSGSRDVSVIVKDANGNESEVLKHFDFDHHRMTQSVIVRSGGKILAFVKGSGESIQRICQPNALPNDFTSSLRASAKAGIYQISMAMKELPAGIESNLARLSRDEIEKDLTFIGVVNFKNVLRDETPAVIQELEDGEVRCVMVTGDSVLTGICIARESGIIMAGRRVLLGAELDSKGDVVWLDEDDKPAVLPEHLGASNFDLAVTGEVWESIRQVNPKDVEEFVDHIRVYGRCTPIDKVSVVTHCIDRGFITLMCGDGGNDCGALKTAHVGIALSDAEASIVSPFTSLDKTITSVVVVLREGRCALASALASYKFMIMYGQLIVGCNIMLAYFRATFTEWCWVFIDGIWTISFGFTLALSKAADRLAPSRPTSSLLGPHTMSSTVGVLFIHYLFDIIALAVLFQQHWFQCRKWNGNDISNVLVIGDNYETETLFLVTGYQFISTAMTYNFGYEFRDRWINNRWLVVLVIVFSAIQFYITLVPGHLSCLFRVNCSNSNVVRSVSTWEIFPIQNFWNTTVMPTDYRFLLLFLMILNALAVMSWDYFAVNGTRKRMGAKKRQGQPKFIPQDLSMEEQASPV